MDNPDMVNQPPHYVNQGEVECIDYIKQQLAYAEEQLMLADSMSSQVTWGNRCDALEAALRDLEAA